MGAQWKQKGREIAANKKGKLVGKMVKEIMIAAKLGGGNPDLNARLFAAIEAAKKASVTRDAIERAVKKGSGQTDEKVDFETVIYEGFAPHKVPVMVECLTDNRNRTAPEIKLLFKAGQMGAPGSLSFMFDHVGVVEASHADAALDLETVAIEAGAENVETLEGHDIPEGQRGAAFTCAAVDLGPVSKYLKGTGWNLIASEMRYIAKNLVELTETQKQEALDFLHALDDHDDVHRVYAGL
ncbi:MAG: YebC/PmpR family DNA-binding transcriptional regulator, partial [Verrucomicrobiae bacterium]|nr:YebC/PmpR family DNA-binding transcriptional regulator [Verrucomicrobiae bacterium]